MTKKKKILIGIGITFVILSVIGALTDNPQKSAPNNTSTLSQQINKEENFDLQTLQQKVGVYWTTLSKEGDKLNILIAPVYEISKKPSATNIAVATYNLAKNLCLSNYPDFGKIKLQIGWKDSKDSSPQIIAVLEGTKADFCVGYERAKEQSSDILAGYIMMNNLFSFPKKEVKDYKSLNQICKSDYIQKFCKEFQ